MITRAKVDSVHNRRMVARDIKDKAILAKLFTDIGPRFESRPGGYTRMLKIGHRRGDASEMVLLELVEEELEPKAKTKNESKGSKTTAKKSKTKGSEMPEASKSGAAPVEPAKAESAESGTEEMQDTGAENGESDVEASEDQEKSKET